MSRQGLSLVLQRRTLVCIWLVLITLVTALTVAYILGLWTVEFVNNIDGISKSHSSMIVKARLPTFISKQNRDTTMVDFMKNLPDVHVSDYTKIPSPNCMQLIQWNKTAIKLALIFQQNHPYFKVPDSRYPKLAEKCDHFIHERKYVIEALTNEERDFPIAYSIVMYEDVEQFERLLRAIYRPQNYYCIHVDLKSTRAVHRGVKAIARCFNNVLISSKLVNVKWGTYSVLEAELICMNDLWKYNNWKYFINLTGREFPLQTNLDIVKILKVFNGSNNIEATIKMKNWDRTAYVHNNSQSTNIRIEAPPVPVTLSKGSVHITASRSFINFVLHDARALLFREWVKDTGIPDETFFSSLNHSPQLNVPGAYKGVPETDMKTYPLLTRFKNWGSWPFDYPCYGLRLRRICIFGIGDLKLLSQRPEIFANKFHLSLQPVAFQCMEEILFNRTAEDRIGTRGFDSTRYENYDFVWNHI